jgi:hypothetical protein
MDKSNFNNSANRRYSRSTSSQYNATSSPSKTRHQQVDPNASTLDPSQVDELFLEGAAWMGRKVVNIADRMGEKV